MALFDIDETMLSNLPYYASHRFTFSRKTYDEWSRQGIAPPLLPTLEFYKVGGPLFAFTKWHVAGAS